MKCLSCSQSSWQFHEEIVEPLIDGKKFSIPMVMFKCNYCGQTSADQDMMEDFVNKCIEIVKCEDAHGVE